MEEVSGHGGGVGWGGSQRPKKTARWGQAVRGRDGSLQCTRGPSAPCGRMQLWHQVTARDGEQRGAHPGFKVKPKTGEPWKAQGGFHRGTAGRLCHGKPEHGSREGPRATGYRVQGEAPFWLLFRGQWSGFPALSLLPLSISLLLTFVSFFTNAGFNHSF